MSSRILEGLFAVTLLAVASTQATAQTPAAGPAQTPAQAPTQTALQGPPQIPYGAPISIEVAKRVAGGAIGEAQKNKWNMAIAIVDSAGFLVYFERMPNTQLGSVDLAIDKARTSALFRRPTKAFQDTLAAGGDGLRVLGLKGVNPNGGGIPIIVDGKVIGAIGISGARAEQDDQVAAAGMSGLK